MRNTLNTLYAHTHDIGETADLFAQRLGIIYNDDTDLLAILLDIPEFAEWFEEL